MSRAVRDEGGGRRRKRTFSSLSRNRDGDFPRAQVLLSIPRLRLYLESRAAKEAGFLRRLRSNFVLPICPFSNLLFLSYERHSFLLSSFLCRLALGGKE